VIQFKPKKFRNILTTVLAGVVFGNLFFGVLPIHEFSLQNVRAADQWEWSITIARSVCDIKRGEVAPCKNYVKGMTDEQIKNTIDPVAFKSTTTADQVVVTTLPSWDLESRAAACTMESFKKVNTAPCKAAVDELEQQKEFPNYFDQKLKERVSQPTMPASYRCYRKVGEKGVEKIGTSDDYPYLSKYNDLLNKKSIAGYDYKTFDYSATGFTSEQGKECLRNIFFSSIQNYNKYFNLVAIAALYLGNPPRELIGKDGKPLNMFFVLDENNKPRLQVEGLTLEQYNAAKARDEKLAIWESGILGVVGAAVVFFGVILSAPIWVPIAGVVVIIGGVYVAAAGTSYNREKDSKEKKEMQRIVDFFDNKGTISGEQLKDSFKDHLSDIKQSYWIAEMTGALIAVSHNDASTLGQRKILSDPLTALVGYTTNDIYLGKLYDDNDVNTETLKNNIQAIELNTLNDFIGNFSQSLAALTSPEVRAMIDDIASNVEKAYDLINKCGNIDTFLGVQNFASSTTISVTVCNMVLSIRDFSINLLESSASLLARTAGMKADTPPEDDFFARLVPRELTSEDMQSELINQSNDVTSMVRAASDRVLGLVNIFLIFLFIVIALATILQIQINTYEVRKLLPGLVIGFLLANMSILAVRASIEFVGTTSGYFLMGGPQSGKSLRTDTFSDVAKQIGCVNGDCQFNFASDKVVKPGKTGPNMALVYQQLFLNIFIIVAAVLLFCTAFLFMLRALVFYFLIPIAPLAFFSSAVKPLAAIWSRWYKTASGWLFMPLVTSFWIWLGFTWVKAVADAQDGGNAPFVLSYIMGYTFGIVCLFLALKTPFSMAGEASAVLNKWAAMPKKAGGFIKNNRLSKAIGAEARYNIMERTPIGAFVRGKKQLDEAAKIRRESAETGPVFRRSKEQSAEAQRIDREIESNNNIVSEGEKAIDELNEKLKGKLKRGEKKKIDAEIAAITKEIADAEKSLVIDKAKRRSNFADRINSNLGGRVLKAKQEADLKKNMESTISAGIETRMLSENEKYLDRADFIKQLEFDAKMSKNSAEMKKGFNFITAGGNDVEKARREHARISQIEDEAGLAKYEEKAQALASEKYYNEVNNGQIVRARGELSELKAREGGKRAGAKQKTDIQGKDITNLDNEILGIKGKEHVYERAAARASVAASSLSGADKHAAFMAIDKKYGKMTDNDHREAIKAEMSLGLMHRAVKEFGKSPNNQANIKSAVERYRAALGKTADKGTIAALDGIEAVFDPKNKAYFEGGDPSKPELAPNVKASMKSQLLQDAMDAYKACSSSRHMDLVIDAPSSSN